ncbi:MAG: MoaD/ThiS family protein [Candidatus Aenigmarchaeota archaeon]|nr:MoaD/ThiS family protein [Candidatus Aenigmarchaeota archaeon]
MKIKVIFEGKVKQLKAEKGMSIAELARKNGIILSNYIVKVNDVIVPEDEKINEKDKIEFLKVISGG